MPRHLALALRDMGYDAIHTLDLSEGNRSTDPSINVVSLREERVVISKDSDFIDSLLISNKPYKLLYVATGNISNAKLLKLFADNVGTIDKAFETYRLVEITSDNFIIHE